MLGAAPFLEGRFPGPGQDKGITWFVEEMRPTDAEALHRRAMLAGREVGWWNRVGPYLHFSSLDKCGRRKRTSNCLLAQAGHETHECAAPTRKQASRHRGEMTLDHECLAGRSSEGGGSGGCSHLDMIRNSTHGCLMKVEDVEVAFLTVDGQNSAPL